VGRQRMDGFSAAGLDAMLAAAGCDTAKAWPGIARAETSKPHG